MTQAETFWARCKEFESRSDISDIDGQEVWDEIRATSTTEYSSEDGACYFWEFEDGSSLAFHELAISNGWLETDGADFQVISIEKTPDARKHFAAQLDHEDDYEPA
jgi:hypothetical protein